MVITTLHLSIALGISTTILLVWVAILEWRFRRITRGAGKKNMEQHLATIAHSYEDLTDFKQKMEMDISALDKRLKGSIRGTGTIRFHPFAGSGSSKPSFATVFLSEKGDGLVLSTLHAHNSLSIFSKSIKNFKTEKELSEEETKALEKAKDSLHT